MKNLLLIACLFFVVTTVSAQEFDIKNVWKVERAFKTAPLDSNGLLTTNDTVRYETGITPVAGDSVAVIFESSDDSVTVSIQFRPTSPGLIVDPKTALDSVITLSANKVVHFSTAKAGATTKQYGKFYITLINNKKIPAGRQKFALWVVRRYAK